MRSPTSSHRRLHARTGAPAQLRALAEVVDELAAAEPGHLLVYAAEEPGGDLTLGTKPFDTSIHPFHLLAGFTAPPEWSVFGIRAHGTAHHLGQPEAAGPISTTYLVDRGGREASRLRCADGPIDLRGPAEGTLPDLCRRVLGLPTPPPPAPTPRLLWITLWLDRIMAAWADPAHRHRISSTWTDVVALRPPTAGVGTWAELRADPTAVTLPEAQLPAEVAAWMDDGCYARWVLGTLPAPDELVVDVLSVLDEAVSTRLRAALLELLPDGPT